MSNELAPGNAGLVAPSPSDQEANPPGPPAPAPGPQIGSTQDAAAAKFNTMKEAQTQLSATEHAIQGLMSLGDTVSSKEVVKAASGMVAAGIPAAEVATILADMPETAEAIQSWLGEMDQGLKQKQAQVEQAMKGARYDLGLSAMRSILAHSAEDHFARRDVAAAAPPEPSNQLAMGAA